MITIRPMIMENYEAVIALWQASPGVGLSRADSPEAIAVYLERNPGLSFVACEGDQLVGAVLSGHDGRRGYLYHLAVSPAHRRAGVGRQLAEHCAEGLQAAGIDKVHLFVFHQNDTGRAFWQQTGWHARADLLIMSKDLELPQDLPESQDLSKSQDLPKSQDLE